MWGHSYINLPLNSQTLLMVQEFLFKSSCPLGLLKTCSFSTVLLVLLCAVFLYILARPEYLPTKLQKW